MTDIKKTLGALGLLESEIKTYLAALHLGPSTVITLAKATHLSRQAIYDALGVLTDRGIMSSVMQGKKRLYTSEHPEMLLTHAKEKQADLDKQIESLKEMIPKLELQVSGERPVVKMLEGKEGAKMMAEIVDDLDFGEELYELAETKMLFSVLNPEDLEDYREALKKKKVQVTAIVLGDPVTEKPENVKRRILLDEKKHDSFAANLIVAGNKVFAVSFTGKMYAVYIENADIANTLKTLFRLAESAEI